MHQFKQLALIGATASGKSSLAIKVAHHINAYILSLDSLSIYKEIDIVSAKPTQNECKKIIHFGIDYLFPYETFNVTTFIQLYQQVYQRCLQDEKNLIIVGGTSFYLKMLIEGISQLPVISEHTKKEAQIYLQRLNHTYRWLYQLDPHYMSNISSNDTYRIEKVLHIYLETRLTPSSYFSRFPPTPAIKLPLPIYQIVWERDQLRKRIALRTNMMLKEGLIDEISHLEKKYGRAPNCMKSIGIKETLAYLDGIYDKRMLIEKIITNTARLAKRQTTFNNSQFHNVTRGSIEALENILLMH